MQGNTEIFVENKPILKGNRGLQGNLLLIKRNAGEDAQMLYF